MRRLALVAAALSCFACTGADRYRRPQPLPGAEVLTVFVPGYEGTFLYEGDERVWVSPKVALSSTSEPLGSCGSGMRQLEPGGPVTRFSAWPYRMDVYSGFMKWAAAELPGFVPFGYDWRADLNESADRLCAFIGDRRANIVAHSMGGIVAELASLRCGDRFEAVVFAGTPFGGAPGALHDLLKGELLLRNRGVLSAEALWTFPAKWQMLPNDRELFVDEWGAPLHVPLASVMPQWELPCPARLSEGLAARERLPPELPVPGRRVLAVIGVGRPSLSAVTLRGGAELAGSTHADGDGAVTAYNATPPFPARAVTTRAAHRSLLSDRAVQREIRDFLFGENP